jgi:Glycosyltransferase family 87
VTPFDAPGRLPGAALCAALLALALVNASALRTNDFQVFHTAGARALRGESLYRAEDGRFPFKYAPVVGLLLAPVGALPLRVAKAAWELASALAVFVFLREAARLAAPPPTRWLHPLALLLLWPYVWHLFSLGQIDGFLLAAIALSERQADRRPVLSGFLWALAVLTKPPYLVFLAVALLARQWRRLLSLLGWLLALTLSALPLWGMGALTSWWAVLGQSTPDLLCSPQNQSLWALACRYTPPCVWGTVASVGLGTLALAAVALWAARAAPAGARATGTSAALAATALVSPLGWWTNFIALAPLVYGLLGSATRGRTPLSRLLAGGAVLGLASVAVLTAELISRDAFVWWLRQKHYGLVGLACVLTGLALRPSSYSQPMTTSSM